VRLVIYKKVATSIPLKNIKRLFAELYEPEKPGIINIVFTDDKHMKQLNRHFRKLDKTTDVLSFNLEADPAGDREVFGEIYISVRVAQRQAKEYGASLKDEYLRLICHGFLHLLGYDHMKKKDAAVMEKAEKHYLGLLV